MAAGRYDTDIEQGETFIRVFTWKDSTGTAVNVTGYTARMQLRRDATSATAEHSFTSSDSIALGGSAGNWDGSFAEVLYWNTLLTNDQQTAVEAYILAKWGI